MMKNSTFIDIAKINNTSKQVLLGSILGDSSLRINGKNCYFEEIHSIKQKDYLIWKGKYLYLFNPKLKVRNYRNKKLNKIYKQFALRTPNSQLLTKYYYLFYPNGDKVINSNILNQLDNLGLGVWYLDDGHIRVLENTINLLTNAYSYIENEKMQKWFKRKFDICPKIKQVNGTYELHFNKKDSTILLLIFKKLFKKFDIPKCMWYKLGRFWSENLNKIELARKKKNEYKRKWRRKRREAREKEKLKKLKVLVNKIRDLYWKDELSLAQIGEKLGYSHVGILKMMRKFNIPRRTLNEACLGEKNGFYGRRHSRKSIEQMLRSKRLRRSKK